MNTKGFLLCCAALFGAACTGPGDSPARSLGVVRALPYIQPAAAPELGPGLPVVVEFWATWCPPCVESVPHLAEIDQRLRDRGLVLIGVHAPRGAEDEEGVRRFVESRGVEYAIALDRDGDASRAFGVQGIPKAFVFDRAGKLVWEGHPLDPAFEGAVEGAVGG